MSEPKPFIICESLVKIFKIAKIEVLALQGLDFTVFENELIGIVGASGSGKSTLMNVLGGLTRPSAGQVWVDGRNLLSLSNQQLDEYRQTYVGFVWQQAIRNLIPYLNVDENIRLPMTLAGTTGRVATKRITELLELVGLGHRRNHLPVELSGGEQQRVAIARAVAKKPDILLCDEPTGALDLHTGRKVLRALVELNETVGMTILIITHNVAIAAIAHRLLRLGSGTIAEDTEVRDRLEPEEVAW
jgi:ABC-type lipoprotein export system ATPase subunit